LLELCRTEISQHGFEAAKVSQNPRNHDYVCCLYWHDDSRKQELFERYRNSENIRYRWWKSNADTQAGKYSEQADLTKQFSPCNMDDPYWD
jgi:hypothetical protein